MSQVALEFDAHAMVRPACQCGCGETPGLASRTDSAKGWVKGFPKRFVAGHGLRCSPRGTAHHGWKGGKRRLPNGYIKIFLPGHPRANSWGLVREHVVVVERSLGRPLPAGAIIHHANKDPSDNRPQNLVVCPNDAYHRLLHQRTDALSTCGNASWRKCVICKQYDDPSEMYAPAIAGRAAWHRKCHAEREHQRRMALKVAA